MNNKDSQQKLFLQEDDLQLEAFNFDNLPLILDVVEPLWCPSVGSKEFKRFNVEYIIRNNIWENDYRFQLVDTHAKSEILSAGFFARKEDTCIVEEWFSRESQHFPEEWKRASEMSRRYLTMMDEETLAFMNDDDIKLSLFISRKQGAGSYLLKKCCQMLRDQGWKNLFLWTDCECNWQWYIKHGFTLLQEASYEPFSSKDEDYKTYIFKRKL